MIDKIVIDNIQSHKNTELNLSKGINVIVGSSNNGKSAILRALYWAIYNRPLGIDTLCSHWALDDKGKQKADMKVTVVKGENTLVRKKNKDTNQYVINDKVLEAIKTDVPNEVKEFFKLTETNIQKQQDTPFLVSSSNYEVAKYFNSIARLDIIDKVLSYTEQTKRKVRYKIEDMETKSKDYEKLINSYEWTQTIIPKLEEYENIDKEYKEVNEEYNTIVTTISDYKKYADKIENIKSITAIKPTIDKYDNIVNEINNKTDELNTLSQSIISYSKLISSIKLYDDIKGVKDDIGTYDRLCDKLSILRQSYNDIDIQIDDYKKYLVIVNNKTNEIAKLKATLPSICPLCGSVMKEDNHEVHSNS